GLGDGNAKGGGKETRGSGGEERGQVARVHRAAQSRSVSHRRRAELVTSEHPAEHHVRTFWTEAFAGEFDGWRDGGQPVEAVKDREQRQPVESEAGERQINK